MQACALNSSWSQNPLFTLKHALYELKLDIMVKIKFVYTCIITLTVLKLTTEKDYSKYFLPH